MTSFFPDNSALPTRRGLRDDVYERVLDLLLSERMPPGSRLSIDRIARELDVSPTPVREALAKLESTHLVTREALKGYRVAQPLTAKEIYDLVEVRKSLEVTAVRLAAPNRQALLPMLEKIHQRHYQVSQRIFASKGTISLEATKEYFAADLAFHLCILQFAHNDYLMQMYENLGALTHRMRQTAHHGPDDVREAHAEHNIILEAIRNGDTEAMMLAVGNHIDNVRARSLKDVSIPTESQ